MKFRNRGHYDNDAYGYGDGDGDYSGKTTRFSQSVMKH